MQTGCRQDHQEASRIGYAGYLGVGLRTLLFERQKYITQYVLQRESDLSGTAIKAGAIRQVRIKRKRPYA